MLHGTIDAIHKDLMRGGWLQRYKLNDGFGTPTVAFVICTFWLIEAGLPISLHFVFRKSGDAERVALIVAGIALILGGLLTFLVIAPDLWEHAD